MMDSFVPHDVTSRAKTISTQFAAATVAAATTTTQLTPPTCTGSFPPPVPAVSLKETDSNQVFPAPTHRYITNILSLRDSKIAVRNRFLIQIGDLDLQLSGVEQLCDSSQTRSIADILVYLSQQIVGGGSGRKQTMSSILDQLEASFDSPTGLDVLFSPGRLRGNCARPRRFEIASAINRLRTAKFLHHG